MKALVSLICGLSSFLAVAQPKKIATVELSGKVTFASVDRPGDLYISFTNGTIQKISKDGVKLATAQFSSAPTLLDPRDGVLAFAYHRTENKFNYLDHDLAVSSSQTVHPEFAIKPWLVAPSKNEIWILDSADLSLKKTGGNTYLIQKDIPWSAKEKSAASQLASMREYQNFLFILDRTKGVHVFNSFGKWIKTLGQPGIPYFNFLGEEFYVPVGNIIQCTDLYTAEMRSIELPYACDYALLTDERMFLIKGPRLEVFEYTP